MEAQNICKICDPKSKYNDCICCPTWCKFDETFEKIQDFKSDILKDPLRISTVTLCFNLNSDINFDEMIKTYPSNKTNKFYNSIIYNWHTKYQYKTIVSVNIFPNGKFQIAGLVSTMSCAYIMRKIHKKIYPFLEDKENSKIINARFVMINSDFKLISQINIVELCKILSQKTINNINNNNNENNLCDNNYKNNGAFLNIIYQPIKYPAINTKYINYSNIQDYYDHIYKYGSKKKYKKSISILIFRSGSIIITGGNSILDYYETYTHFLNILSENYNYIKI